jgi:hypothetical protein
MARSSRSSVAADSSSIRWYAITTATGRWWRVTTTSVPCSASVMSPATPRCDASLTVTSCGCASIVMRKTIQIFRHSCLARQGDSRTGVVQGCLLPGDEGASASYADCYPRSRSSPITMLYKPRSRRHRHTIAGTVLPRLGVPRSVATWTATLASTTSAASLMTVR